QYLEVDGKLLLAHTLRALLTHPTVEGAVIVLAGDDLRWPGWTSFADKPVMACTGGSARADSVLAGLAALPDSVRADDFVLIHDAARPNLHRDDLDQLLERGRNDPVGAILASPVRDTLKRADGDRRIVATQSREQLWRALTPQAFRRGPLTAALQAALAAGIVVTDEAMAMEHAGARPCLVEGREDNLKVTTPADLALAEYLLARRG
ncbi:MAG: 2-C-methyl-D-erythritol 4-phosphate cytidylyltransferase, partial [Lysobacter sp.]|nr:2-C-methyl-D-erythritol 4-phosphate cytidylyltransferase [Lysobacter sp.]